MSLRLVEMIVPEIAAERVSKSLGDQTVVGVWEQPIADQQVLVRVLLEAQRSESLLDSLEKDFGSVPGFRIMLWEVEATLPRLAQPEEPAEGQQQVGAAQQPLPIPLRISREELYSKIAAGVDVSRVFIVTVVLSTLVAAIGLMRDDLAVIIGAMVIAPLLGPNVGLALATTLADSALTAKSLLANGVGVLTALGLSCFVGMVFAVDPAVPAIAARTSVGVGDVMLALAAGCAGALAFTTGVSASLIGVMVAVALLPPLVVFGLLVASGNLSLAWDALLLVLTNVISVNLAGVLTFVAQGIRPRTWWEADRAKVSARKAIVLWLALLALLTALIVVSAES